MDWATILRISILFGYNLIPPGQIAGQVDTFRVYFSTDESRLTPGHESEISDILQAYEVKNINRIEVLGYADLRGTDQYNQELSASRAKQVQSYIHEYWTTLDKEISLHAGGEDLNAPILSDARRVDILVYTRPTATHILGDYNVDEIPVEELREGSLVRIKNLNFRPGRDLLLTSSIPQLKELEKIMHENPNMHIEIQGHVCCPDKLTEYEDGYNLSSKTHDLSMARARNIYNYLIKKGIAESRLSYRGFGATVPLIYPEDSEHDKMQNRRVELLITAR